MVGVNLDQFLNLPDPAPLWRFRIQMPVIRNLSIDPAHITTGSFTFPFVDADARAHSGSYTYYPQFNNIDALDLTFIETSDYYITTYLLLWQDLVFSSEDGTYAPSDLFKRPIYLVMQDNSDRDVLNIRYNGTFPTRINNLEASENEDYYRISCNFSVDSNTVLNPVL